MFMSGADQTQAELRLPSIKGALRFWWRALAWERLGGNLEAIRKEEAALFGSTDTGQAGVLMRLATSSGPLKAELADVNQSEWRPNTWRHYSGYGIVTRRTRTNPQAREQRNYLKAEQRFSVVMLSRSGDTLSQVDDALKLLGLLGGLGARSRNGWGSVTLEQLKEGAEKRVMWEAPKTTVALEEELRHYFQASQPIGSYTSLSRRARFALGPIFDHPEDAHEEVSELYKEFLGNMKGDREKRQRESFGLPRNIKLRSGRYDKKGIRRASGVFLHIHQFPDGKACPVVAVLPAQFLEVEREPEGGWNIAFDFLDYFKEEAHA